MIHLLSSLLPLLLSSLLCANTYANQVEDKASAKADTLWQELYQQGKYYMEHSNSFRAMQCLEQAEQLHSSDTIRRDLAQTYYNRGKFQQCIDLCRSVLYPDTLDSDLYLMARSFEKMEKADSALKYQMMVAERNIENYSNLATLCNTLINASYIDQALLYLDAYCAIDSTNSAINSVKAYALHRANRHKEAIAIYEKLKEEGITGKKASNNFYAFKGIKYNSLWNRTCDIYIAVNGSQKSGKLSG